MTPAISPENKGAPLAGAMPRHSGTATKNTTTPAGRSWRRGLAACNSSFSNAPLADSGVASVGCPEMPAVRTVGNSPDAYN